MAWQTQKTKINQTIEHQVERILHTLWCNLIATSFKQLSNHSQMFTQLFGLHTFFLRLERNHRVRNRWDRCACCFSWQENDLIIQSFLVKKMAQIGFCMDFGSASPFSSSEFNFPHIIFIIQLLDYLSFSQIPFCNLTQSEFERQFRKNAPETR